MKNFSYIEITKESFAEQKPQGKGISITRVQANKLSVASPRVPSSESITLRAKELCVSLSHCKLRASKLASCQSVSL